MGSLSGDVQVAAFRSSLNPTLQAIVSKESSIEDEISCIVGIEMVTDSLCGENQKGDVQHKGALSDSTTDCPVSKLEAQLVGGDAVHGCIAGRF